MWVQLPQGTLIASFTSDNWHRLTSLQFDRAW